MAKEVEERVPVENLCKFGFLESGVKVSQDKDRPPGRGVESEHDASWLVANEVALVAQGLGVGRYRLVLNGLDL
ncbi:hypothetical protein ACLOJK_013512 [Asimina triloba]